MPDPAQAAVTALTGTTTEAVGRFSYDVPTDTWWWSTSLYTVYGFAPVRSSPPPRSCWPTNTPTTGPARPN